MNQFNPNLLQPHSGRLDTIIFQNSYLEIPETLFYTIQIDLKEIFLADQAIETSIILNFIRLNINRLKELENKVFEFPVNPDEGYIDGSILLFDVHNPFDVKKIEFSDSDHGSIDATLHFDIDFEYEDTGYEKLSDYKLKVNLSYGYLSFDEEMMAKENFTSDDIKSKVSKFASLDDYEEPEISFGQILLKMRPH
ncbi:hypothetical protein [Ferruginibacter sp.]